MSYELLSLKIGSLVWAFVCWFFASTLHPQNIIHKKKNKIIFHYESCLANGETNKENRHTPINNASFRSHLKVVKYLYETCHANVEDQDECECTPINNASKNGHHDIIKDFEGKT